ncbi:MAG: polyphosphate polymerase domain-containing protein [Firmicutes bacterium]|nr:polyphosphate polymerase domain-containing protein [Bacillota bacterium]
MAYQAVFKRYELKYRLTVRHKEEILKAMEPYMALDRFGRDTVRNIYFDTENYRLIRRSIEKPAYKEKLRLRCYRKTGPEAQAFVELKKKYDKVVYKRRVSMKEQEAMDWLCGEKHCQEQSQIVKEIDYFLQYYGDLRPAVCLFYNREAYYCRDGSDFRVTFDDNILFRTDDLSLDSEIYGTPVLPPGQVIMELKCSGGIPLWMTEVLSRVKAYKTSFSKYGTVYREHIFPKLKEEHKL